MDPQEKKETEEQQPVNETHSAGQGVKREFPVENTETTLSEDAAADLAVEKEAEAGNAETPVEDQVQDTSANGAAPVEEETDKVNRPIE